MDRQAVAPRWFEQRSVSGLAARLVLDVGFELAADGETSSGLLHRMIWQLPHHSCKPAGRKQVRIDQLPSTWWLGFCLGKQRNLFCRCGQILTTVSVV